MFYKKAKGLYLFILLHICQGLLLSFPVCDLFSFPDINNDNTLQKGLVNDEHLSCCFFS